MAPLIGGPLLDVFNRVGANRGYVALMVMGAVYYLISALTIWKIRGARSNRRDRLAVGHPDDRARGGQRGARRQ